MAACWPTSSQACGVHAAGSSRQADRRHSCELRLIADSWQVRPSPSLYTCWLGDSVVLPTSLLLAVLLARCSSAGMACPRLSCCPVSAAHLAAEPAAARVDKVLAEYDPLCLLIALNVRALGAAGAQQQAPGTIAAGVVLLAAEDAVAVQLIPRPLLDVCCCCCWCWCHGCPPRGSLWDSDAWKQRFDHDVQHMSCWWVITSGAGW